MSYLNAPRFTFFGQFLADPSTLNNDACNYNPDAKKLDPSWNPDGSHSFKLTGCTVTGLTMPDGSSPAADPFLGSALASVDTPYTAKLVDLDTEQQSVSMIFGMKVEAGNTAAGGFTGAFAPVCFNDIYARVANSQSDSAFSAYYQSVLENVQWNESGNSPFIAALKAASPHGLSIKFVVDGFQDDSTNPNFTLGRVVGTIGPAAAHEPPNFVVGRLLRPNPNAALAFNYAWALVNPKANTVTLDLGNSLAASAAGGPVPSSLGTLTFVVLPAGTPFLPPAPAPAATLGTIDTSLTAYRSTAWIQQFSTTPEVIAQLQSGAELAILQSGVTTPGVVLQENETCGYICATPFVFRMDPGQTASVQLMAVRNGAPAAGQTIALAPNNSGLQPAMCKGANLSIGVPLKALKYPASATTGHEGTVSITLSASDPGNPRTYLNGQIYGVGFTCAALDSSPDPNWYLSVHVYGSTPVPDNPTWYANVLPILQPFAVLYPFMDRIIQLNDFAAMVASAPAIAQALALPIDSPHHMPVTRDMSADQRNIVLKWIKNGTPEGTPPPK